MYALRIFIECCMGEIKGRSVLYKVWLRCEVYFNLPDSTLWNFKA